MSIEHKTHRWVFDYAEYDLVPGTGMVLGPYRYVCAYCKDTLVVQTPLKDTEFEFNVVEKIEKPKDTPNT